MTTRAVGFAVESEVLVYLQAQGLTLNHRNYRTKVGEIDLIMQDKNTMIFIEVRHRANDTVADGFASVDLRKQQKIITTAKQYLLEFGLYDKLFCRFDVVATSYKGDELLIDWLPNAFMTND